MVRRFNARKTFVIRFAAAVKSVLSIAKQILSDSTSGFKYLLTYNFSQEIILKYFFQNSEDLMVGITTQMCNKYRAL